jgi:hypothetical protein
MKKNIKSICIISLFAFALTSCYNRIGKLTMISTRNVDSKSEYKLLQKDVTGKGKTKKRDALEIAIDNAVKKEPTGEFMMNVVVSVSFNGKKIKVVGDIWGIPSVDINVNKSVNANIEYKVGNNVTFKILGKIVDGKILGLNTDHAVVEHKNALGKITKSEVKYENLTKIGE